MPLTLENTRPLRGVTPSVALLVVSDGRWDYLAAALQSLEQIRYPWSQKLIVDDSGTDKLRLVEGTDTYRRLSTGGRQGLAAAVNVGWAAVEADYVFHFEEDFVCTQPIPIRGAVDLLSVRPHLAQVAFMRQPVPPTEVDAGSVVDAVGRNRFTQFDDWFEHREFFTLNPSVIPHRVFGNGWPTGNEAGMAERIFADQLTTSAYWGQVNDPPRVVHIGVHRSPGWKP